VADLARMWEQEEQRIGCAIDLRVLAVAALRRPAIEQRVRDLLSRVGDGSEPSQSQMFNLLQSLLWLRCSNSCPDCIEYRSPYHPTERPSRFLLELALGWERVAIAYGTPEWRRDVIRLLEQVGIAWISCQSADITSCVHSLTELVCEPVDRDYQTFYPSISGVTRRGAVWEIEIALRELSES
jgi:hypothetical protein